jgi:Leucine-rich repeat (LRR) protein
MDILNIIRNANETGQKKLDLSNLKLEKIPNELLEVDFLEELYLRNNNIEKLPENISKLKNLKYIDCSNNDIEELPKALFNLGKLTDIRIRNNKIKFIPNIKYTLNNIINFDISDNKLKEIPDSFCSLDTLSTVDLRDNQIKILPKYVNGLRNLKKLKLSNNKIDFLPDELYRLYNLEELHLRSNNLECISNNIGNLKKLVYLGISDNRLENIPDSIIDLKNLNILNLNDNIIEELPNSLYELKSLTELNLSNNNIKFISEKIVKLKNLNILNIRNNNLKEIPELLADIKNLEDLDIRNNLVKDIPVKLKNCKRIFLRTDDFFKDSIKNKLTVVKELSDINYSFKIFNNKIIVELPYLGLTEFPKDIFELKEQVLEINLKNNKIKYIPKEIMELKGLKKLNLSGNLIKSLPNELYELKNLTELHLSDNMIAYLSENIKNLSKLKSLYLNKNDIISLPRNFTKLKNLKYINFENNPLINPPIEIAKKGINNIINYFSQIDSKNIDTYDLKLIVIGSNMEVIEDLRNSVQKIKYKKNFRVNIMYFLNKEFFKYSNIEFIRNKTDFLVLSKDFDIIELSYFINTITMTNIRSNIFILSNNKFGLINESEFNDHFDNNDSRVIMFSSKKEFLNSFFNNQNQILEIENYKKILPQKWIDLRNRIENIDEIFISLEYFYDICDEFCIENDEYKLMILEYLHDISSIIYFKNDKLLKETIFINPQKIINYIRKILNNEYLKSLDGPIKIEKGMYEDLGIKKDLLIKTLHIMKNFKLCYRFYHSDTFMIPQMLSENRPKYMWDEKDELVLRVKYEFLPGSVINRIIVDLNKFIYNNIVWKRGLIVSIENNFAEIIEYYNKNEIRIRVTGKNKSRLMSVLIHEIKKMNCAIGNFKYKLLIPCNCKMCLKNSKRYYHDYLSLKRALNLRKDKIQCMSDFNMVDIKMIIEEYENYDENNIKNNKLNNIFPDL